MISVTIKSHGIIGKILTNVELKKTTTNSIAVDSIIDSKNFYLNLPKRIKFLHFRLFRYSALSQLINAQSDVKLSLKTNSLKYNHYSLNVDCDHSSSRSGQAIYSRTICVHIAPLHLTQSQCGYCCSSNSFS